MSLPQEAVENALLAALPSPDLKRLLVHLKPVSLSFGDILYEPDKPMGYVYFPVASLISLLSVLEGRRALEVGMIGREGMLGVPLALGARKSSVRALVQGSGMAMRMPADTFLRQFRRSLPLQRIVLAFTHELTLQVTQGAACNRFHLVNARLARWLLMTRDRVGSTEFRLTHAFLADMLGVRRTGVTQAASGLQRRRLIAYSRGTIRILNERELEATACSCYTAVRGIYKAKSARTK